MSAPLSTDSDRLPTGDPGLDSVLFGGLLRGSMNVISGPPGSGKTMLASQIAFAAARRDETVVYVSLLSESQTRLVSNLRSVAFFDGALAGSKILYVSGAAIMEGENGLAELSLVMAREVRARRATLLVLDSTGAVADLAQSGLIYRRFLRELATSSALAGCAVLLLVPEPVERGAIEQYVADCVIELHQCEHGLRHTRELAVSKFRGSHLLTGRHVFEVDRDGVKVHPRLESYYRGSDVGERRPTGKVAFGVPGLDGVLEGGIAAGSVTALLGVPGSGKTLLGLQFLAEGLKRGEHGVYFGLYETPARVLSKALGVSMALQDPRATGKLELLWMIPTEQLLDGMAEQLLAAIAAVGATRVFIDGADGMLESAPHPERFPTFFSALSNALRDLSVTTMVSMESPHLERDAWVHVPLSAAVDNIILVRYVQVRSRLHRLLSIPKVRESGYDPSLREFRITPQGLHVEPSSESAEHILREACAPGGGAMAGGAHVGMPGGRKSEGGGEP